MNKNIDVFLKENNLPNKEEIFIEFGRFNFDDDADWIMLLLEKLSDKATIYIKFLEDMLQPDSNISSMHESSIFTNDERKQMFLVLRNLFYWERKSLLVNLNNDEKLKINYFNEYFKFWKEIKIELKQYIDKAVNTWKEKNEEVKFEGYFG